MIDADSLLTKTTISTALAFKGSHASAFGYLAHCISHFIWTRSKLLNSIHLVHFIFCPYGHTFITTNFSSLSLYSKKCVKCLKRVLVHLIKNEQSPKFIFCIHTDFKILCWLCVMRNIKNFMLKNR